MVMTKSGNQPRLLTAVMEAIANLKEGRGSTQKKIIDQVQCVLTANKMSFRNPAVHIKKAIKHGVRAGLIRQKGGKFKLGLDSKDYAIFKNFQKMKRRKELPLRELRRGRRRRKKSRRRRRRRRRSMDRSSPDEYLSASGSGTDSITGTPEPADKGRRRKRKRRRRRGRRRTEEREGSSGQASSDAKEVSPSVSNEENTRVPSKSDRDRDRDNRDRDRERNRDRDRDEEHCDEEGYEEGNDPSCGNPDCLCNLINVKKM